MSHNIVNKFVCFIPATLSLLVYISNIALDPKMVEENLLTYFECYIFHFLSYTTVTCEICEKEFKLGSGNTLSWKEYKNEALKCMLVCSNCHKEIHSEIGYIKQD